MSYKVFLVDDDLLNLAIVKKLLKSYFPSIDLVGEASSLVDLGKKINVANPDLMILDINIGHHEIFEIFDDLSFLPQVIFVSTNSSYAYKAFEIGAVDFVLKPIDVQSFVRAVNRAVDKLERNKILARLKDTSISFKSDSNFITISSLDKHDILRIHDIMYFKADGKCTIIFLKDGRKVCSYKNLGEFDFLALRRGFFIKVSRSCILNFEYVTRILKKDGLYCELDNGELISVSRRKEDDVKLFLRTYSEV